MTTTVETSDHAAGVETAQLPLAAYSALAAQRGVTVEDVVAAFVADGHVGRIVSLPPVTVRARRRSRGGSVRLTGAEALRQVAARRFGPGELTGRRALVELLAVDPYGPV